jgi:hypothetical protein
MPTVARKAACKRIVTKADAARSVEDTFTPVEYEYVADVGRNVNAKRDVPHMQVDDRDGPRLRRDTDGSNARTADVNRLEQPLRRRRSNTVLTPCDYNVFYRPTTTTRVTSVRVEARVARYADVETRVCAIGVDGEVAKTRLLRDGPQNSCGADVGLAKTNLNIVSGAIESAGEKVGEQVSE